VLYTHRSSRSDRLVDALADVLQVPLADVMAREVVAVPTMGVERWLAQCLALSLGARPGQRDGVCTSIDFPFPGRLVAAVTGAVCAPTVTAEDPWRPERYLWDLLELVDDHLEDERLWPLARHLRACAGACGPDGQPRRFATVQRLARLYERYVVYRPEMLLEWEQGAGGGPECSADTVWQAELWRLLRDRLGGPSPAERLQMAPALVAARPESLALPERVSVFGLTRLARSHLRILQAVAVHRDVHLFLLHPSPALWQKVASATTRPVPALPRVADATAVLATNPLLRSWSRDARELQLVLAGEDVPEGEERRVPEDTSTLLGMLQADIRADRRPPGPPHAGAPDGRPLLSTGDNSLQVHACHGRARQVEVARDAVLHILQADPSLQPRDVIVMCPDIELFAPLVQASFNVAALAGVPPLRARLADRSLRQTNPMLGAAAHLLELAASRVTAPQVLDFASRPPVARRFGFTEDGLSQLERWLAGTATRWGLDSAHRARWKLGNLADGTLRAGLDRLLLGVAMAEDGQRLFGGALPFGDVASGDIELAGRVAELGDRLGRALDELSGPHRPQRWAQALVRATNSLAAPGPDEAWQADELARAISAAAGPAAGDGLCSARLDLDEARAMLADQLRGRPTRANFRTGDMTICTLVPMRSVPHRVVCLLGLDDGHFPRPSAGGGDDLLLADQQVGDPDTASEDRQLLLDALLAATQHLVITYEGRDQHLNQLRPPAVPVAELLDVIDRTVRVAGPGRLARDAVVIRHPLQAFDPANFRPGALTGAQPWGFDEVQLGGATALSGLRGSPPPFLSRRLPPVEGAVVQLSALIRFLEHPVRAFLRERLGLYATDLPEQLLDALPVELSALERWALGDRLLEARLEGADLDRACAAERGRGFLPPGPLGDAALAEVEGVVEALIGEVAKLPCNLLAPTPLEVDVALSGGTRLVGTVAGMRESLLLRCTYSKLRPKHRLRAWAQFLAVSAAHPHLLPSATTIGQAEGSSGSRPRTCVVTLEPLAGVPEDARRLALEALEVLVDLYRRGMCEPLPIYCATSAAWAAAAREGASPADAARERWSSTYEEFPGEDAEPEHAVVLGRGCPFSRLMAEAPAPDESGRGWPMGESSRLGRLATKLWAPVLVAERRRER